MTAVMIFDPSDASGRAAVDDLRASGVVGREVDGLPEAIEELFRLEFPFVAPGSPAYAATFDRYLAARWNGGELDALGVWIFFPWRSVLVRLPPAPDFTRLRSARNRFLITDEEQDQYYAGCVGVAGLSVGLSVVTTLVLTGGAGKLRVADHDVLGLTNLNRLVGSVTQLGQDKTAICAERVYELNPFIELESFDGITDDTRDRFLGAGGSRLDVLVEEMDDIRMKALIRFEARQLGIPVVMATDNGDNEPPRVSCRLVGLSLSGFG